MRPSFYAVSVLATTVASQYPRTGDGPLDGPNFFFNASTTDLDDETGGRLEEALQNPDATRSVKFKPYDQDDIPEQYNDLRDLEWTWRVNVSQFEIPSDEPESALVTTSYDLSWPTNGTNTNISTQLMDLETPLCVTLMRFSSAHRFPANFTNKFTDTDSASCESLLGEHCVQELLKTNAVDSQTGDTCEYDVYRFWNIPACADTFGQIFPSTIGPAAPTANFNLEPDPRQRSLGGLRRGQYKSGDRFLTISTGLFDPEEPEDEEGRDRFAWAAGHLHIMRMQTILPMPWVEGNRSNWRMSVAKLVCTRVNMTELQESSGGVMLGTGGIAAWAAVAVGVLFAV